MIDKDFLALGLVFGFFILLLAVFVGYDMFMEWLELQKEIARRKK